MYQFEVLICVQCALPALYLCEVLSRFHGPGFPLSPFLTLPSQCSSVSVEFSVSRCSSRFALSFHSNCTLFRPTPSSPFSYLPISGLNSSQFYILYFIFQFKDSNYIFYLELEVRTGLLFSARPGPFGPLR